jgi:hypothetical protein
MDFIARANQDPGSRLLKILDINHNLGRIHLLPIAEQGLRRRYVRALNVLCSNFCSIRPSGGSQ